MIAIIPVGTGDVRVALYSAGMVIFRWERTFQLRAT
jgi:hypothetical protein